MNDDNVLIPDDVVITKIYNIRGQKVMMDEDLAELYQVRTKRLNEQVKRNSNRFPFDFMFQLSQEEFKNLKSQNATSRWGGRRIPPFAFTEHGVLMLSSVLRNKRAVEVNIQIMRVFMKMREMLLNHKDLLVKMGEIEKKLEGHDEEIIKLFEYLTHLMEDKVGRIKQEERTRIGYKGGEEDKR